MADPVTTRPRFWPLFFRWLLGWMFHPVRNCRESLRRAARDQKAICDFRDACGYAPEGHEEMRAAFYVRDPWGMVVQRPPAALRAIRAIKARQEQRRRFWEGIVIEDENDPFGLGPG